MKHLLVLLDLLAVVTVTKCCFQLNQVDCMSTNSKVTCQVNNFNGWPSKINKHSVWIKKLLADHECEKGTDWDFSETDGRIWAANGCQARFQVVSCVKKAEVTCPLTTPSDKVQECKVPSANMMHYMELREVLNNKTACLARHANYGISTSSIWTRNQCRGTFFVCFK